MSLERLSEAQIEHFRTEGYLVLESLFDTEDLAPVDECIERLSQQAIANNDTSDILELEPKPVNGHPVVRRIYNPYDQDESFRRLATKPRLLDSIESLIGPDINIQHSKLNMKPARVGSVVEWHQDLAYFPHTNDDLITTLVYLDDATEENGCLQVLPRHQHHFFNHHAPDGTFAGMMTEDISDGRFGRPRPLPAPAGSVILMHCILPHSSLPNHSDRPRRTLIFEFRAADSFPIHFGEMTARGEERHRQVRGKPARFARFGGPPPLIPGSGVYASLYDLQERSKAEYSVSGISDEPKL